MNMRTKKKIIIIGAGFGGVAAAKRLKKSDTEILIIDKTNHFLFQPLLYQVAGASLSPRDIAMAIREIFAHEKGVSVIMGEVIEIHKTEKYIVLGNKDRYDYDYLIVSVGARHSYFGNHHWESFAPGLKTLTDALKIREKVLTSFEIAERCNNPIEADKYLTFAIVGGGPTGVELAGTFAEICRWTLRKNFSRIASEKARVILIEGFNRILPPFNPALSHRAQKDLEKMGVEVLTDCKVTDINEDGIQTNTCFIPSKNVLWAAGNQASPLLKTLDVECDRAGRAIVDRNLNIPGHKEIFVIGDAANFQWKGTSLPAVAPVAIQQGNFVGKLIKEECNKNKSAKQRKKGFSYLDKGGLATIGTWKAVGYYKKIHFTGVIAWFIWGFIHIVYLIGYRNRLSVMLEWILHTFTGKRGSRLIHGSIDEHIPPVHKEK
jgi:NADH dehydrogenase